MTDEIEIETLCELCGGWLKAENSYDLYYRLPTGDITSVPVCRACWYADQAERALEESES
jgi:hypothetical protein